MVTAQPKGQRPIGQGVMLSGAEALALGALDAGASLVTGYPGAPATAVVDAILNLASPEAVRVEWTSNEKVALEMAFGASVGGVRSAVCIKGVGLNIALDPLMVINLSGCNAGMVILVGDDPGSWGSQNEQDSRALGLAAEIPVLEPASVADALAVVPESMSLSERMGLPVMVRFTRALALAQQELPVRRAAPESGPAPAYQPEFMRWVVLPINVVPLHRRLARRLEQVQIGFEASALNRTLGDGCKGIITAGFDRQKLLDLLGVDGLPSELRLLSLGTFNPLPQRLVLSFLKQVQSVMILEETAPLLERAVRACAQEAGLTLPIYGRDTGHVPSAGELFAPQMAVALNGVWPELGLPAEGTIERPRPSREPLCGDCPYHATLSALKHVMDRRGGRDNFIVVGEPGCMVRAQLPPYHLMDVKTSLGASVGMATGVALADTSRRVVALCGDSAFLHSGLNALVDAARVGASMLLLILDNGTTALSGGQPHPASGKSAWGEPSLAVDLAELGSAAGAGQVKVVNLDGGEEAQDAIEGGLSHNGLTVIVARGRCTRWS